MLSARVSRCDPIVIAALPAAPWYQPIVAWRGCQAQQAEVQALSDRLFPIDIAEVHTAEAGYVLVAVDRLEVRFVDCAPREQRVSSPISCAP